MSDLVGATPPTATINLTPTTAQVGTVLTALATTADLNGLPVTLTYIWSDNGTVIQTDAGLSSLSDTLTPAHLAALHEGDTVSVTVTPADSLATGVATAGMRRRV